LIFIYLFRRPLTDFIFCFLVQILGSYNTAIMYVKSAPDSPNCASIAKEILALAQASGRLCLATLETSLFLPLPTKI